MVSDSPLRVPHLALPAVPWRPGDGPRPAEPVLGVEPGVAVLHGADLFDHGAWWEAHAVWEAVWHGLPVGSPEREAVQAMIQAAAYHLKGPPELRAAGERLRQRALRRLEHCISVGRTQLYGIDLRALHRDLAAHRPGSAPLRLQGGSPLDTVRPEVP